jgi:hypothetical protein
MRDVGNEQIFGVHPILFNLLKYFSLKILYYSEEWRGCGISWDIPSKPGLVNNLPGIFRDIG